MSSSTGDAAAVAGVINRPRLNAVLDSHLIRLCVLQGPAGCGKTTLLRHWSSQRDGTEPIAWVSLNRGVNNVHAFWQQVGMSMVRTGLLSTETEQWLREALLRGDDFADVSARVAEEVGPLTVILDGYEHLGDAMSVIDRDILRVMERIPDLRLIVTTRTRTLLVESDPPGGMVRLLTLRDLSLTADEVQELIAVQTGINDRSLADSVVAATHGLPVTVRAIALTLSQLGSIPNVGSLEWNTVVSSRLESLLPNADVAQFVTDTSIPPYVDVELATALSGRSDARQMLELLERDGLGYWIPYARNTQVFQYVDTIRDSFRSRATKDLERFRSACAMSASWLLAHDELIEQTLQLAIEAKDYRLTDRVFMSMVIGNPDTYTTDRFLHTLRQIPDDKLAECPMAAFGLALAYASNPVLREHTGPIATIVVESAGEFEYTGTEVDAIATSSLRAIALRLASRHRESSEACVATWQMINDLDPDLVSQYSQVIGVVLRQMSMSLFFGGRIDEARQVIEKSVSLCSPETRDYSIVYLRCYAALSGDEKRSAVLARLVNEDAWPSGHRLSSLEAPAVVADSCALLDNFDFLGALDRLRDAEQYMPTSDLWPLLANISVMARFGRGTGVAEARRIAEQIFAEVPHLGVGDNIATERLRGSLAITFAAAAEYSESERMLEGLSENSVFIGFARILRFLKVDKDEQAFREVQRLLSLPGHTIRTTAELQTVGAVAALRVGQSETAWHWLVSAVTAWDSFGVRVHVALLDPRDRRLLWEYAHQRECEMTQRYLDIPPIEPSARTASSVILTKREAIVLEQLAQHESIRAIADELVVSPHTIKSQLQSIYRKLGVSSRQTALAVAREVGLLEAH